MSLPAPCLVVFASLNQVHRLKRHLYQGGVYVDMVRAPQCLGLRGCSFALRCDAAMVPAIRQAWVFPAPTSSGHIEPSSLKKQHTKAVSEATRILREETSGPQRCFAGFELYTLRRTCLTRWAPHMDPWTLAYLAGHRDMNITKRYVHPQEQTILAAMEKARVVKGGHSSGHTQFDLPDDTCGKRAVTN